MTRFLRDSSGDIKVAQLPAVNKAQTNIAREMIERRFMAASNVALKE
jgi:hypothetical protein